MRFFAALLMLFGGCAASDPCGGIEGACLQLTVTSMASLSIDTVRVTAAGAIEGMRTAQAGKIVALPIDVPIALPKSAGGAVSLFVEGLAGGSVLGVGQAELNITIGARPRAAVDIEPAEPPPADLGSGPPADMAISLEAACAAQAHGRCSRIESCATIAPTLLQRRWGELATCETRLQLECMLEAKAPGSGMTTAIIQRCAASYATQPCADRFAGFRALPCLAAGTGPDGAGCVYDSQCMSGFCRLASGQACGACAPPTTPGSSPCAASGDCSGRQTCAAGVCQLFSALNAPCGSERPCGEELACVGGVCKQEGSSIGVACDGTGTTQPPCDLDLSLYCSSSKCAAVGVATVQNPQCGSVGGVRTVCTNGADCFGGVCKSPSADDAACDSTNGPTCRLPARCQGGICRLPDPASCG